MSVMMMHVFLMDPESGSKVELKLSICASACKAQKKKNRVNTADYNYRKSLFIFFLIHDFISLKLYSTLFQ